MGTLVNDTFTQHAHRNTPRPRPPRPHHYHLHRDTANAAGWGRTHFNPPLSPRFWGGEVSGSLHHTIKTAPTTHTQLTPLYTNTPTTYKACCVLAKAATGDQWQQSERKSHGDNFKSPPDSRRRISSPSAPASGCCNRHEVGHVLQAQRKDWRNAYWYT